MSNLQERYFVQPRLEEEEELTALEKRRAKMALLLRDPFFNEEFIPHLETLLEQHDPQPSHAKEDMLYHIGVRDGLKLVRKYVEELRHVVRSE